MSDLVIQVSEGSNRERICREILYMGLIRNVSPSGDRLLSVDLNGLPVDLMSRGENLRHAAFEIRKQIRIGIDAILAGTRRDEIAERHLGPLDPGPVLIRVLQRA